jgi:hypothetical protein
LRLKSPSALFAFTLLLLGSCCVSRDARQACDAIFSQPVPLSAAGRREFQLVQESRRYEYPDIENADGTITRVVWLQNGQGDHIKELLKGHPTFQALKLVDKRPNFFADALSPDPAKPITANEGLMLVGTRDHVLAATDLVSYVLTSIPQIEIEARIVEVREDDDFALGTDMFVLNRGDHPFDPEHPNAPLDPTASLFDRSRSRFGLPGVTGAAPVLLELGTISHGLQMDLLISAMKMLTKTDVLSAPRIAVLNGFKAEFAAGEDVPILEQSVLGTTVVVTT